MKKIIDLYFSPKEVFKQLSEKPDWVIPVVLTLIISLIFTMILLPKVILSEGSKKILAMERLTGEQKEAAVAGLKGLRPYITTQHCSYRLNFFSHIHKSRYLLSDFFPSWEQNGF